MSVNFKRNGNYVGNRYNDVLTATEVKRNYNAGKRSHR